MAAAASRSPPRCFEPAVEAQCTLGRTAFTAARAPRARGAVIGGLVRDVRKIEELGAQVHAGGIKPVGSVGRGVVTAYDVPVECAGVLVHPGVPRPGVLELAAGKVERENHCRAELMNGALREVYKKYGVL